MTRWNFIWICMIFKILFLQLWQTHLPGYKWRFKYDYYRWGFLQGTAPKESPFHLLWSLTRSYISRLCTRSGSLKCGCWPNAFTKWDASIEHPCTHRLFWLNLTKKERQIAVENNVITTQPNHHRQLLITAAWTIPGRTATDFQKMFRWRFQSPQLVQMKAFVFVPRLFVRGNIGLVGFILYLSESKSHQKWYFI